MHSTSCSDALNAVQAKNQETAQALAYSFGAGGERTLGGCGAAGVGSGKTQRSTMPETRIGSSPLAHCSLYRCSCLTGPHHSNIQSWCSSHALHPHADESALKYPATELEAWVHLAAGGQQAAASSAALAALRSVAVFGTQ